MTLLFILLGFILGLYLFIPGSSPQKQFCKQHKWVYNNEGTDEEYMSCSVCGRRPGHIDDGSVL